MKEYRITKYNPEMRDEDGCFTLDDWTDWSDIGRVFNGEEFSVDEYIETEKKYIEIASKVILRKDILTLRITRLEMPFNESDIAEITDSMKEKSLYMCKEDLALYDEIKNGKSEIHHEEIASIIRLLLRGFLWCELICKRKLKLYTGYDLYMYIHCDEISVDLINSERQQNMYIEDMAKVKRKYT